MNISKKRLKQEIVTPSRRFTKFLLETYYSLRSVFKKINLDESKTPTLIWDIRSNPITFDFIWLIIDTNNYFREYGFFEYDLVIFIPQGYEQKPFKWNSYDQFFTSEDLMKRIKNMIVPLAESFSCVRKVIFETDSNVLKNKYKNIIKYPRFYDPFSYFPNPIRYSLAISSISTNDKKLIPFFEVKNFDNNEKITDPYATLTLRDHGYSPLRNSSQKDIDEFIKFATSLNFKPVIVPDDIEQLPKYNFPENIIICSNARFSIFNRILLYSGSEMNIFPPSGPFYVSLFLKNTKSVMYNIGVNWDDDEPPKVRKIYGYDLGDQPYINLNGKLIWHEITPRFSCENLQEIYASLG